MALPGGLAQRPGTFITFKNNDFDLAQGHDENLNDTEDTGQQPLLFFPFQLPSSTPTPALL